MKKYYNRKIKQKRPDNKEEKKNEYKSKDKMERHDNESATVDKTRA